jgi:uncharacterized RDD family membrane protein YckC
MMEYHLSIAGERTGPHSQFYVIDRIREGVLDGRELVWRMGMDAWLPLKEVEDFSSYWPPSPEEIARVEAVHEKGPLQLQPDVPRPWMRFWARMVDYFWFTFALGMIFVALLPPSTIQWLMGETALQMVFNSLSLLLYAPLEAGFLSRFGTTPGRALLRIQIRGLDGALPSYRQALIRSLLVWAKGLGFCFLPILSLATMAWWRIRLMQKGVTSWDETCGTHVQHGQPEVWRFLALTALVGIVMVLVIVSVLMSQELQDMMRNLPK